MYSGKVSNGVASVISLPPLDVSVSTDVKTFFHTDPFGSGGR